jgi:hypothetical protein
MTILTAEQIAAKCEKYDGRANIAAINRLFRQQDESNKFPINGKFDATERAIRRVRKAAKHTGGSYGLEYAYAIDAELSEIVNGVLG